MADAETIAPDTPCDSCGHPRSAHKFCSDLYPMLCAHADPIPVDATSNQQDYAICWCLEFENPEPPPSREAEPRAAVA